MLEIDEVGLERRRICIPQKQEQPNESVFLFWIESIKRQFFAPISFLSGIIKAVMVLKLDFVEKGNVHEVQYDEAL